MKIQKQTSRRFILLTSLFAVIALLHLSNMAFHLEHLDPYRAATEGANTLGTIETGVARYRNPEEMARFALPIQQREDGTVEVAAVPSEVMLYIASPDYQLPEIPALHAARWMNWLIAFLVATMTLLLGWFLIDTLLGFRSGTIFTSRGTKLIRALAPLSFLFLIAVENRAIFQQTAIHQLFASNAGIPFYRELSISPAVLITPLLLLIFAELMAIANRLNEEESATL